MSTIIDKISKLFLLISFSIFVYIFFQLTSNVSSGFDITDESFYILSSKAPFDIFSFIGHNRFYTSALYYLSGENLGVFRLYGIFILLGLSLWFSVELYKYLEVTTVTKLSLFEKLLIVLPIVVSSLVYYFRYWLITPSYNWLALISVILFFASIFRILRRKDVLSKKWFSCDYVILSFALTLSFMAKPTTAIVMTIISLLFLFYGFKSINVKYAIPTVIIITIIMVFVHILLLDGGLSIYLNRLTKSLQRMTLLREMYTLESRFEALSVFKKYLIIESKPILFWGVFFTIGIVLIKYFNKYKPILNGVFITIVIFGFSVRILDILMQYENKNYMWMKVFGLFVFLLIIYLLHSLVNCKIKFFYKEIIKFTFLGSILLLGSIAVSFGTGNIVQHITASVLFIVASTIIISFVFLDKINNNRFYTSFLGVSFAVFVLIQFEQAFEKPYRLTSPIDKQNKKVDLLGGIYVDFKQQNYIEYLQKLAQKYKINEEQYLIDLTGGSPGANIILDMKFFGTPWLIGSYKGSDDFAYEYLKPYKGKKELKNAWLLIAHYGKRKLNLNVLKKIGLSFPQDYVKIGIVRTAHRSESQQVWMPKGD